MKYSFHQNVIQLKISQLGLFVSKKNIDNCRKQSPKISRSIQQFQTNDKICLQNVTTDKTIKTKDLGVKEVKL